MQCSNYKGLRGLYKMEGFYRKKSGAKELLTKEKKVFFLDQNIFFWREGNNKGFLSCRFTILSLGDGKGP